MALIDKILSKLGASETKIKVFRNLYWAVLGKVVTLLGGLFVGILVARYLGPEQYGLMSYVISYVSLFQIFASFGMEGIEVREMSKDGVDVNLILGTVFRIKLILAIITVILVIGTAFIFESDSFTVLLIVIYSFSIILNRFSVIRSYFTAIVWNEYIVKTEISRTILGAIIKIVLLLCKASLWTFVVASVFDILLLSAGYVLVYQTKIASMALWKYDRNIAKYFFKQSFPLMLSGAAVVIYQRIDQVMIGNMIDKESVGQFSVAARFVEVLIFVPTIIAQTITPVLVKLWNQSDKNLYKQRVQLFMNVTIWGCLLLVLFVFIFSDKLIIYTFGREYIPAITLLQVMVFKTFGIALAATSGQIIVIEELQKYAVIRNMLGCFTCIGLNLLMIPILGVIGAAYVSIIATIVSGCLSHLFIPQYRSLFYMQIRAIGLGWIDLFKIKSLLK